MFTSTLTPAIALTLALTAGACTTPDVGASGADPVTTVAAETVDDATLTAATSSQPVSLSDALDAYPVADLTEEEIAGLVYMREEEKLAYDVYVTLYDQWGLNVFSNISKAETTHQEWVAELLDRYGIADPATTLAVGEFSDPVLQSLYDDLVARGLVSEVEALMVGALIEELDIEDLRDRASTNADIALVYAELERGSRNHLRAFVRQLDRVGVDYEPVYLDPDAYDAIVSTDTERGGALSEGSMHESGGHGNGGGQGHGNGQGQGNGGNGRRNG